MLLRIWRLISICLAALTGSLMLGALLNGWNRLSIDDHLGGDIGQFTSLPCLYLLSHRLEVSLHPINANRDAVR
jgi:hypothetical protein